MKSYFYTNQGPRELNEDSGSVFVVGKQIYACIADGVGGLPFGEKASRLAVEKFKKSYKDFKKNPAEFIATVNNELIGYANGELETSEIGTTFTGLTAGSNKIKGIHIGDTRANLLRGNEMIQLTLDQNEAGRLKRENESSDISGRQHVLESILGVKSLFFPFEFEHEFSPNNRIILSSDGFHELISKTEIIDISLKNTDFTEFYHSLTAEIEQRDLRDNATFVCIELDG